MSSVQNLAQPKSLSSINNFAPVRNKVAKFDGCSIVFS